MVRAPGLIAWREHAETVRLEAQDAALLRKDLRPARDGEVIRFPLVRDVGPEWRGHAVEDWDFEPATAPPPPWQELAARSIPEDLRARLPSSFDHVGHVVILKLPEELEPFAGAVGEAILATVKRARTVAVDEGVTGELRVRELRVVAGEPVTLTEHVEHGVRMMVDPAAAYFSPRLAHERKRVADLVAPGERVVDLMAGVAPFALVIARHARPSRVDAVDLNPEAVRLARRNVDLNRAGDVVHVHEGDARAWAAEHAGVADRVITNLPHGSATFAEDAWRVLKPGGGTWHHHVITSPDDLDAHVAGLAARAEVAGRTLDVTLVREVRTYSPTEGHFAVDVRVSPRAR